MKNNTRSLFIFRRDLRLIDNNGLLQALNESKEVIPCFIFDERQVDAKNSYRSMNAIQFMIASLTELDKELRKKQNRLYFYYGNPTHIIGQLIKQEKVNAVFCNRDYTPFSIERDEEIKKICIQNGITFTQSADLLLHEPEEIKTGNGDPYSIFTAFYKKSLMLAVQKPKEKITGTFYAKPIKSAHDAHIFKKILTGYYNSDLQVKGGRKEALAILKGIKNLEDYATSHNVPSLSTSNLSAHLKFGTVSIRETYWHMVDQLGLKHPLLRQLYWRDFFTHIAYYSPFVFGQTFRKKYNSLPWKNDSKEFKAWCQGRTGFPIVDAGMRQLNATGWMHNRVRLIVASLLIKDLHIDWQWGEKYFAQVLVDYDPAVNNGNWQWSASTGCDAQPYFRIFNPWLQQKKFDPQCTYIKKWVPELAHLDAKVIHSWNTQKIVLKDYPKPIVDHSIESAKAKMMYKRA